MRFLPLASLLLATACVPLSTPITSTAPGTQRPPECYPSGINAFFGPHFGSNNEECIQPMVFTQRLSTSTSAFAFARYTLSHAPKVSIRPTL